MNKPTVCFDFDGTICTWGTKWQGAGIITGEPIEGVKEFIDKMKEKAVIAISSCRAAELDGYIAIHTFCNENNIYFDLITHEKPVAIAYIDDRGITFDGEMYKDLSNVDKILNFQPWYAKQYDKITIHNPSDKE